MNKKLRNLIIGGVVLLALVGVLLVLMFTKKPEDDASSSMPSYVSDVTYLFDLDAAQIAEIEVENEAGGFVIEQTAEELYGISELEGYTQLTDDYETIWSNFAKLSAVYTIEENPSSVSKYGLDQPQYTVTIRMKDGSSSKLMVGNALPTSSGYYVQKDEDPTVYSIATSRVSLLGNAAFDFVDKTIVAAWTAPTDEDGNATASAATISCVSIVGGSVGEDGFELVSVEDTTGLGMASYDMIKPISAPLNTGVAQTAIFDPISNGITADSVAALAPDEEALASYGLDAPYATVSFTRDDVDFSLTVGAETTTAAGTKAYYVMLKGREVVYVVTAESLPWISINVDQMITSLALLPYISEVSGIDIEVNGETHRIEAVIEDSEEEDGKADVVSATLDGVAYKDIKYYRQMYQFILYLPGDAVNREQLTGDLLVRYTYHYRDSSKADDVVEIRKVSDRRCAVLINGDNLFLGRSAYVDALLKNIDRTLNGPQEDVTMEW